VYEVQPVSEVSVSIMNGDDFETHLELSAGNAEACCNMIHRREYERIEGWKTVTVNTTHHKTVRSMALQLIVARHGELDPKSEPGHK
jgi:hypothetical protein